MTEPTATYADLFAGIGGFAAVLQALGVHHAYAVEIDKAAATTYARNWGHDPLGDVTVDTADITTRVSAHTILTGGFPCQPFSKSGAQRGMDETRGTLFHDIMKIVQARRPPMILLENVRNLIGPRHAHEWALIIDLLREAGYQVSDQPAIVSPHQIKPEYGGAPQVRERVFITATLVPEGRVADPTVGPVTILDEARMDREWDLNLDLPLLTVDAQHDLTGTELSDSEVAWIDHWESWVQAVRVLYAAEADRDGAPAKRLPGFPIWAHVWTTSDRKRRALMAPGGVRVPAWKANFLTKNWDLYDGLRARGLGDWLDQWLRVTRTFPESRQKLEWQAQDTEHLWDCAMSLRPSGIRAKRMTHLPALVAITQTPILGPKRRRLAPREAARMQGLPDNYDFGGQRNAATFKQLGNGVNAGVVWNVLRAHVARDRDLLMANGAAKIVEAVDAGPDDLTHQIAQVLTNRKTHADADAKVGA